MTDDVIARIDDEAAVLGAIMVRPARYAEAAAVLAPEDFYRDAHQRIFACMGAVVEAGLAPDFRATLAEIERQGVLEHVGGKAYYASVLDHGHLGVSLQTYLGLVKDAALRRQLRAIGHEVEREASSGREATGDAIGRALRQLQAIEARLSTSAGLVDMTDAIPAVDARVRALLAGDPLVGLSTGFPRLDARTGPLCPGQLWTLGARPGQGKTAFATQVAWNIAATGGRVAFFSLEMSAEELLLRMITQHANVNAHHFFRGRLGPHDHPAIERALDHLTVSPHTICDEGTLTVADIRRHCEREQATRGLDLVVVDYLQLLTAPRGSSQESRAQQVGAMSRGLKTLARDLSVPVIALSQLSRATETRADKRPQLSDLRESGAIEQDSDKVLFLYPADDVNDAAPEVSLIVAKNRQGPTGVVHLVFIKQATRFEEAEPRVEF